MVKKKLDKKGPLIAQLQCSLAKIEIARDASAICC